MGEQENPELYEDMKKDMEKKHATMRMQRQTNARKKWALQAARFGGKDLRQSISKQAQIESDEKAALRKAAKGKKSHDEDSDSDIDVDGENASETLAKTKKLTLLEMESDEEDNSTKKGLMGLKFMQEAIQKKREEAKLDAQKLLDDLEVVAREEEEADDGDKEKNSKVFTGEELAKAAASLDVKSTTLAVSEPLTVKSTTASEPLAVMKKKKKKKVQ